LSWQLGRTPQASNDPCTSSLERGCADAERRGDVVGVDALQQHREYYSVAIVDPIQQRQRVGLRTVAHHGSLSSGLPSHINLASIHL
jgi:hypothetical protein